MVIKILHLINGEKIIGRVEEESDTEIIISKPYLLLMQQNPVNPESIGIGLIKWILTDEAIVINKSAVIVIYNPSENIKKYYYEVSSDITISSEIISGE